MKAPRGTFDVLPEDGRRRLELFNLWAGLAQHACFNYVETPVFEDTELFSRGVGESTDVVQKEMFTFEDKAGRSLTLRPEGTASICRAYAEHGMHKRPQPVKVWYWGPFFRHEAPQAGRFRQFAQAGAETLGTDEPSADAEQITLLSSLIEAAGCREVRLRISSLGTAEVRGRYADELRDHLRRNQADLSETVRARIDVNPLRAFDSDDPSTQAVMDAAPKLLDRLDEQDSEHLAEVRSLLDGVDVSYEIDPTLVRGLDYYTRTVFEFESGVLGAQAALGGGGRYDGLVQLLGGPPTPAVGWAAGIERILLAASGEELLKGGWVSEPLVYVAASGLRAFLLASELRREHVATDFEQAGRSLKGQLKQADRLGARYTVLFDDDGEMQLKHMESGAQTAVSGAADVVARVTREGRGW